MSNASETPNASGFISVERDDGKLFHTKNVSTVGGFHLRGELEDESFELSVANETPPGTYTYPDKKNRLSARFMKSIQKFPPAPPTEYAISAGTVTLEVASTEQMKGSLAITLKSKAGELLKLKGSFDVSVSP